MIFLEGDICSGKSTLGERLARSGLFGFVGEPVGVWQNQELKDPPDPENPEVNLLDWFYRKMKERAFAFQIYTFTTRAKTWAEVLAMIDHRNVVLERSIYCDRYVFAKNCFQNGLMSPEEWTIYCRMWDWLNSNWCTEPNKIVYLRTPAEVCFDRIQEEIKQGQRKEEKNVPLGYLRDLEVLHDEWLIDNPKSITIDGCKLWTAKEFYDVLIEADVALATEEELISARA